MFVCKRCTVRQLQGVDTFLRFARTTTPNHLTRSPSANSWPHRQASHWRWFSSTPQVNRPFKLAIVGSGPAGFYTASRVLRNHPNSSIDMFERLPVPYGLVRYGVAPDHPEVKNCQDRFDEIARLPNFNFIGNVDIGSQIPLTLLSRHYDALLFAYGAGDDRELGVQGEHLKGVWSARSFVGWYNGLPGYDKLDFRLDRSSNAVLIGQGNVSLDVARILLSSVQHLRKTDIPEYALEALSRNQIKNVSAIGRRGPLQAAFTIKEIRELTTINGVRFGNVDSSFFPADLKRLPRARRRIAELLLNSGRRTDVAFERTFNLLFMRSPSCFQESLNTPGTVSSVLLNHQSFDSKTDPFDASAKVRKNPNEESVCMTDLTFRSIGYKSTPLQGFDELSIEFDHQKGIIRNDGGRVIRESSSDQPGVEITIAVAGLYVAGWVKRGPTGVIASTMEDAFATADCMIQDLNTGKPFLNDSLDGEVGPNGWAGVKQELESSGPFLYTTWRDWQRLDEYEKIQGQMLGKEREKITNTDTMLRILGY